MLDGLTDFARDAVVSAGYPGILGIMVLENVFPPIPSEIVLPFAGFEVDRGELAFTLTVLAATLGSLIGALILYAVGLYGGRPIIDRYGRVLRVSHADLDRAEDWFDRWGDWVVLGARMVPLARSVVSIPAGTMRMGLVRFVLLTTLGSLAWNVLLVGLGYSLGANWEDASDIVARFSKVAIVLFVIGIAAGVWWLLRRKR